MKLILGGVVIAFLPVVLAMTSGGSMWDESSGGGAALWLLFFSLPIGGVVALVGLIRVSVAKRRG